METKFIYIYFIFLFSWTGCCLASHTPTSALTKINQQKEIAVCIWTNYFGITYRNPKTSMQSGIDIDMAQAFAKDLGVRLRFVESSYTTLFSDINENRCDIAMFGLGAIRERAEKLQLSDPYLISDTYAIVSKNNRRLKSWDDIDQPNVVVAVIQGSTHETILGQRLKHATLVSLKNSFERELEVLSGRADVLMTDYPYSLHFLNTAKWARRIAPDKNFSPLPYVYATKRGDHLWGQRVNEFVRAIKLDGRLRTSAERHRLSDILYKD